MSEPLLYVVRTVTVTVNKLSVAQESSDYPFPFGCISLSGSLKVNLCLLSNNNTRFDRNMREISTVISQPEYETQTKERFISTEFLPVAF